MASTTSSVMRILILAWGVSCCLAQTTNISSTLKVAVLLEPPFVMKDPKTGQWSGLMVEVLQAAGIRLENIRPFVGDKYGMEERPGLWTGILGKLVHENYDLAVAPFSIRSKRMSVVAFTQPVMDNGYRTLYKPPTGWKPDLNIMTTLLQPFSPGLWCVLVLMGLLVGGALCLIHHYNPYEAPTAPSDGVSASRTDIVMNTFGTLMGHHGGRVVSPKSVTGRFLTMVWWLFSLMTIAAYVAGLVVILVMEEPHEKRLPFHDVDDMVHQTEVSVLGVKNSATYNYISNHHGHDEQLVSNMWKENWDRLMVDSYDTALKMMEASDGKYAVFMDEATAEYLASQEPCDKMVTGHAVGDQRLGFACRKGSHVCDDMNRVILNLQENGRMESILEKYLWSGCHHGHEYEEDFDGFGHEGPALMMATGLTLKRFSAAFVVLVVGLIASCLLMLGEVVYSRKRGVSG